MLKFDPKPVIWSDPNKEGNRYQAEWRGSQVSVWNLDSHPDLVWVENTCKFVSKDELNKNLLPVLEE